MTNIWSKKAYVQGFDRGSINFKVAVKMFVRIEIEESIYVCVVKTSYKNLLGKMQNMLVTAVKSEKNTPYQKITPI